VGIILKIPSGEEDRRGKFELWADVEGEGAGGIWGALPVTRGLPWGKGAQTMKKRRIYLECIFRKSETSFM